MKTLEFYIIMEDIYYRYFIVPISWSIGVTWKKYFADDERSLPNHGTIKMETLATLESDVSSIVVNPSQLINSG